MVVRSDLWRKLMRPRCKSYGDISTITRSPTPVATGIEAFVERTGADELMVTSQIYDHQARLRSYEIVAEAMS